MFTDLLRAARPRQWIKNLLVYAGFLFTLGHQPIAPAFLHATAAFFLFSLLSSAAYLLNDVRDVHQDRQHPRKRYRPIAAGRVSIPTAITASLVLAATGIAGAFLLRPTFGFTALAYLAITLSYSFVLKHVVLLDVLALAFGYVLRAVAGAAALAVPASFWLALCTLLLALFLGLCKRRAELSGPVVNPAEYRAILGEYTLPLLDQMISVATSCALLAYALYTWFTPTHASPAMPWRFHDHVLTFTIPFVVYGIFRYLYLVYRQDRGGSPETLFLEDRPLQVNIALWAFACAVAMTAAR